MHASGGMSHTRQRVECVSCEHMPPMCIAASRDFAVHLVMPRCETATEELTISHAQG